MGGLFSFSDEAPKLIIAVLRLLTVFFANTNVEVVAERRIDICKIILAHSKTAYLFGMVAHQIDEESF